MTIALLTRYGTIQADHSVRKDFADCNTHYSSKGVAVSAFCDVLEAYGLRLDPNETFNFPGPAGCLVISVHDEFGVIVGYAMISWCRMPSGRYEFNGYLA